MTDKEKAIELLKEAKDDVVILNCIELLERSQIGVEKYGTTLSNANLNQKQLIQHALEESLDLSNYLRTILMDSLNPTLKPTFKVGDKMDYFLEENELTRKLFDLDEILAFQLENDVQIIRGEDYQYMCYINKEGFGSCLTPMGALVIGIKQFKDRSHNGG